LRPRCIGLSTTVLSQLVVRAAEEGT
jgi:hypothetical protein